MDLIKRFFILEHPAEITDAQWLIVRGIGLLLVAGIVWKFLVPMVGSLLSERQAAISEASTQVEATLRETEELRNDYRRRLETIAGETERRIQEALREAEALRETILDEARHTAAAIVSRGHDEVERERAKARVHLRTQFVHGVISAAEHAAARSLDSSEHRRLVGEFIKDVAARS